MDFGGVSDRYVTVELGEDKFKTKVVNNTLTDTFNEEFTFFFDPEKTDQRTINVEVWDHDTFEKNDVIGRVSIPFIIYIISESELKLDLEGEGKNAGQKAGEVSLTILYTPDPEVKKQRRKKAKL
ncbi:MAG: hypothetical protein EZS28_022933 [Streblomastix strix]|uniref:C2 domain-containing protein n=1 Tax=Streblomastix strix TaxID=222440 RepID=A0A5J4VG40_9EUKA|nr:MAG: hypothetical protein EZS28_022933 [Streblomastix strix]